MNGYLHIANWDKWQSYRSDRGTPPWIKVHRKLMSNPQWAMLSDAEKGQLLSLWIVAADKNGEIPSSPTILKKICLLDKNPNINKFIELGFILSNGKQDDANMTSSGRQDDTPEERRVEKNRIDKKEKIYKKDIWNFESALAEKGVADSFIRDWMKVRKTKKATNTQTAFNRLAKEVEKSGMSWNTVIEHCCSNDWKGFKAEWVKNNNFTRKKGLVI